MYLNSPLVCLSSRLRESETDGRQKMDSSVTEIQDRTIECRRLKGQNESLQVRAKHTLAVTSPHPRDVTATLYLKNNNLTFGVMQISCLYFNFL